MRIWPVLFAVSVLANSPVFAWDNPHGTGGMMPRNHMEMHQGMFQHPGVALRPQFGGHRFNGNFHRHFGYGGFGFAAPFVATPYYYPPPISYTPPLPVYQPAPVLEEVLPTYTRTIYQVEQRPVVYRYREYRVYKERVAHKARRYVRCRCTTVKHS